MVVSAVWPRAASIPACVTGSYASYEALTGGCVIDNLLFSNFSDLESSTSAGIKPARGNGDYGARCLTG